MSLPGARIQGKQWREGCSSIYTLTAFSIFTLREFDLFITQWGQNTGPGGLSCENERAEIKIIISRNCQKSSINAAYGAGDGRASLAKYKGNADYCGIDYTDLERNSLENKHRHVQTHTTHTKKNTRSGSNNHRSFLCRLPHVLRSRCSAA